MDVPLFPLPKIEADPIQMVQLFQNLMSNAFAFPSSRPGPAYSDLQRISTGGPGGHTRYCEIYVQDHGIGFDEKYLDKIFKPFERLHGRHEYEGTGMGLAICRRIVERHGGSITARSVPGQGTTFVLYLPLVQKKPDVPG